MKNMRQSKALRVLMGMALTLVCLFCANVNALATAETGSTMYVDGDNVNVRASASTSAEKVTTLGDGHEVTITGSDTDDSGETWYQISFTKDGTSYTGYIRHDFLTSEGPAGSETFVEEETDIPEEEETVPEDTQQPQDSASTAVVGNIIPSEGEGQPEVLPADFRSVYVRVNGIEIPAWADVTNEYYIFYATSPNGNEGWYLYDSLDGSYVRYQSFMAGTAVSADTEGTVSDNGGGMSAGMIVLIVLVVVLIGVSTFLGIKLINSGNDDDDDDDDDYDDDDEDEVPARRRTSFFSKISRAMSDDEDYDDDDEDYDEEEDDEDEEDDVPIVRRTQNGAVVRSAASSARTMSSNGQPVRNPQAGGQPVRRVAPNGQPVRNPQAGGQPVRRVAPNGQPVRNPQAGGQPVRRVAPNGQPVRNPQAGGQPVRRVAPSGQPVRRAPQQPMESQNYDTEE